MPEIGTLNRQCVGIRCGKYGNIRVIGILHQSWIESIAGMAGVNHQDATTLCCLKRALEPLP